MKKLSIVLLVITAAYTAVTADGTAFAVASIFFARECGRDVNRVWNNLISDGHDTDR